MTPEQIAKPNTEAAHQIALFAWAAVACSHGFKVANDWAERGQIAFKNTGCSMGVGCDEIGVCFAEAHGEPSQCCRSLPVPELKWLHHIPNGGSRGDTEKSRAIEGGKLKAQGVKKGVLDLFLPVQRQGFAGLYIEMKKPGQQEAKNGGLSDEQIEFGNFAIAQGYRCALCYSWQEAAKELENYLLQ